MKALASVAPARTWKIMSGRAEGDPVGAQLRARAEAVRDRDGPQQTEQATAQEANRDDNRRGCQTVAGRNGSVLSSSAASIPDSRRCHAASMSRLPRQENDSRLILPLEHRRSEVLTHSRSAEKRVRQAEQRRLRNRSIRGATRTQIRKAQPLIAAGRIEEAAVAVRQAVSVLDKAAEKGVIHPNNAARRKSRLMLKYNAAQSIAATAPAAEAAKPARRATTKKTAPAKAPAKATAQDRCQEASGKEIAFEVEELESPARHTSGKLGSLLSRRATAIRFLRSRR